MYSRSKNELVDEEDLKDYKKQQRTIKHLCVLILIITMWYDHTYDLVI